MRFLVKRGNEFSESGNTALTFQRLQTGQRFKVLPIDKSQRKLFEAALLQWPVMNQSHLCMPGVSADALKQAQQVVSAPFKILAKADAIKNQHAGDAP